MQKCPMNPERATRKTSPSTASSYEAEQVSGDQQGRPGHLAPGRGGGDSGSPRNPAPGWSGARPQPRGRAGQALPEVSLTLSAGRSPCPPTAHGPLLPDQSHRRPADPHGQRDASPRWVSWGSARSGRVRPAAGPQGCVSAALSGHVPEARLPAQGRLPRALAFRHSAGSEHRPGARPPPEIRNLLLRVWRGGGQLGADASSSA